MNSDDSSCFPTFDIMDTGSEPSMLPVKANTGSVRHGSLRLTLARRPTFGVNHVVTAL